MGMFDSSIAKVREAELQVGQDLAKLWVEWDPVTQSGALYWHHAAAGALQEARESLRAVRATLETKQPAAAPEDAEAATPEEAPAEPTPSQESSEGASSDVAAEEPAAVSATPQAQEHADALGVDLSTVEGSGVDGKVLKSDVAAAAAAQEESDGA